MLNTANLPDDNAALKVMLIAATAREVRKNKRIERKMAGSALCEMI